MCYFDWRLRSPNLTLRNRSICASFAHDLDYPLHGSLPKHAWPTCCRAPPRRHHDPPHQACLDTIVSGTKMSRAASCSSSSSSSTPATFLATVRNLPLSKVRSSRSSPRVEEALLCVGWLHRHRANAIHRAPPPTRRPPPRHQHHRRAPSAPHGHQTSQRPR